MQAFGHLACMPPIAKEPHGDPKDQKDALMTYGAFFNTEPQIGTMVVEAVAATGASVTLSAGLALPGGTAFQASGATLPKLPCEPWGWRLSVRAREARSDERGRIVEPGDDAQRLAWHRPSPGTTRQGL